MLLRPTEDVKYEMQVSYAWIVQQEGCIHTGCAIESENFLCPIQEEACALCNAYRVLDYISKLPMRGLYNKNDVHTGCAIESENFLSMHYQIHSRCVHTECEIQSESFHSMKKEENKYRPAGYEI